MTEPQQLVKAGQPMWDQLISLSRDQDKSLTSQIRRALVTAILDGRIPHRRALPSTRELSNQLGVARNTVVDAYKHLMDDGYLVSEERRGYFVNTQFANSRVAQTRQAVSKNERALDWESKFLNLSSKQGKVDNCLQRVRDYDYSFTDHTDPGMFPVNEWRECCKQSLAVQEITEWVTDSVDNDDPALLKQIQSRVLPPRGLWVTPEEILVTIGAQNALYLLARLLVKPGDTVGLEDPGYPDARKIFEHIGCNLISFEVDENGLVIDDRINQCDVVFCTPSHQSPTTVTMSLARRRELLKRASRHNFLIFEDDYESEFAGRPIPALKSLDKDDRVIYVGSLSKTLAPGLRLGYMVGPARLINEARILRRLMLRHPPTNNQNAVAHFLALGHHDTLVYRLADVYRERRIELDNALCEHMPGYSSASAFAGNALWVKLPDGVNADAVQQEAGENGIFVSSGNAYFMQPTEANGFLRIGFSSIPVENIRPGIKKLADIVCSAQAKAADAKEAVRGWHQLHKPKDVTRRYIDGQ